MHICGGLVMDSVVSRFATYYHCQYINCLALGNVQPLERKGEV